jgi:hypothetical protein
MSKKKDKEEGTGPSFDPLVTNIQGSGNVSDLMVTRLAREIVPRNRRSLKMMTRVSMSQGEPAIIARRVMFANFIRGDEVPDLVEADVYDDLALRVSDKGLGRGEIISMINAVMAQSQQTAQTLAQKMMGLIR